MARYLINDRHEANSHEEMVQIAEAIIAMGEDANIQLIEQDGMLIGEFEYQLADEEAKF